MSYMMPLGAYNTVPQSPFNIGAGSDNANQLMSGVQNAKQYSEWSMGPSMDQFSELINKAIPGNDFDALHIKYNLTIASQLEPNSSAESELLYGMSESFQTSPSLRGKAPLVMNLLRQHQYTYILAGVQEVQKSLQPGSFKYADLQNKLLVLDGMLKTAQQNLPEAYKIKPLRPDPPKSPLEQIAENLPQLPGMPKWEDVKSGKVDLMSVFMGVMMTLFQKMMKAFKA
ncbi:MAG: hypothetical protein KC476_11920 [Cyanobacteria bacterium HKST-UBA06]|nr:hypothetical protein [Cyanobacteria bacterium HKST-UBA05]MCA9808652.1 hypothetical protein [Cyanobacteria bacterium HKST-UBA06]